MPLHVSSTMCPSSRGQNCIIQHLVSSHSLGGLPVHRLRVSSLNLMGTQCSKNVEIYNKFIEKQDFFALSWLSTKIVLRCAVSRT